MTDYLIIDRIPALRKRWTTAHVWGDSELADRIEHVLSCLATHGSETVRTAALTALAECDATMQREAEGMAV